MKLFWILQACIAATAGASLSVLGIACGNTVSTPTATATGTDTWTFTNSGTDTGPDTNPNDTCFDNPTGSPFCATTCAEALTVSQNFCLPVPYDTLLSCVMAHCSSACPIVCNGFPYSDACAACVDTSCAAEVADCKAH